MARKKPQQPLGRVVAVLLLAAAVIVIGTAAYLLRSAAPSAQTETPETAAHNKWKAEAFSLRDGFLRYGDAPHMVGIDVSTHQGLIDWQTVADAGVEFAILRAGYRGSTEGKLYEDEQFRENLQGARAAGIKVGVYFFSQALDTEEAKEEAEFVCALLDGETLELPVFYDWEEVSEDSRVKNARNIPMTDCALAFCRTVEEKGFAAGVYFNQTYGYGYLKLGELQDYTLWLAEYGETPTFLYHFDCLQYTDSGTVAGIEGDVDLDIWIMEQES